MKWKFKNINKWPLQGHWDPLMVVKHPLTSSEARLLTDIDASLIFFKSQMDMDRKNDNWQPIRGP
jgi:hypothetical protein